MCTLRIRHFDSFLGLIIGNMSYIHIAVGLHGFIKINGAAGTFLMLLETINDKESFAYPRSSPSPVKTAGRESGEHLQESVNETAKSLMSLILSGHSSPQLGSIENLI